MDRNTICIVFTSSHISSVELPNIIDATRVETIVARSVDMPNLPATSADLYAASSVSIVSCSSYSVPIN